MISKVEDIVNLNYAKWRCRKAATAMAMRTAGADFNIHTKCRKRQRRRKDTSPHRSGKVY